MKVRNPLNGQFKKDNSLQRVKVCIICGKIYQCRSQFKYDTSRYCSRKCLGQANKIRLAGNVPYEMTDKTRKAISEAKTGVSIWGGRRGKMEWMIGENNKNWKGGVGRKHNRHIRKGLEFKEWREKVFKNDNWTCQYCGKRCLEIHPHHIFSFTDYPDFRFYPSNGITLCRDCHYLIHRSPELQDSGWYLKGGN